MSAAYTIRRATPADIPIIAAHRRGMFRDMGVTRYLETPGADEAFINWTKPKLDANEYLGWLAVDAEGKPAASAGLWLINWLPQLPDFSTRHAYVLNVFVEPDHRRQGLAHQLVTTLIDWCRAEGIHHITLHASEAGRPIYTSFGFDETTEMKLTLI
jgi:GNAT superfamily N-acetyltransferase